MTTAKLTSTTLKGVWAGVTLPWNEDWSLNEEIFRRNLARLVAFRVHGIYTTGSTGEFYALDWPEFQRMVDVFIGTVKPSGIPTQVGCGGDDTRDVLRQVEYAFKAGADGVQVVIPYWMELNRRELIQYFRDVSAACAGMPMIHYNITRAKNYLTGPDYVRVLAVAPNLIGVKFTFAGSHFGLLQTAIQLTPQLSYFVAENLLVSAMQFGGRGSYSSVVCMNPLYMQTLFSLAESGQWNQAIAMQGRLNTFFNGLEELIEQYDMSSSDPVCDKGLGIAAGFFAGHQRTRPPYIGWSDEHVAAVAAWLKSAYPDLLAPATPPAE